MTRATTLPIAMTNAADTATWMIVRICHRVRPLTRARGDREDRAAEWRDDHGPDDRGDRVLEQPERGHEAREGQEDPVGDRRSPVGLARREEVVQLRRPRDIRPSMSSRLGSDVALALIADLMSAGGHGPPCGRTRPVKAAESRRVRGDRHRPPLDSGRCPPSGPARARATCCPPSTPTLDAPRAARARTSPRRYGYRRSRRRCSSRRAVFERGVGEVTDVVEKELFRLAPRTEEGESWALRPSRPPASCGPTSSTACRRWPQPVKLTMTGPMFRYDRPQAGRYRQFWQFDVEAIGDPGPAIDAEIIELGDRGSTATPGWPDVEVHLNSIGDPACRPAYVEELTAYYRGRAATRCRRLERDRLERNALRLLDSKDPAMAALNAAAPRITDRLCDACAEHFAGVRAHLDALGVAVPARARASSAASTTTRGPRSSSTSPGARASSRRSAAAAATTASSSCSAGGRRPASGSGSGSTGSSSRSTSTAASRPPPEPRPGRRRRRRRSGRRPPRGCGSRRDLRAAGIAARAELGAAQARQAARGGRARPAPTSRSSSATSWPTAQVQLRDLRGRHPEARRGRRPRPRARASARPATATAPRRTDR